MRLDGLQLRDLRNYGEISMPAGMYHSLKIIIGEGNGQNWWCVMYPPMCLDLAKGAEDMYTDEEYNLISPSGYRIKFKLLELACEVTRKTKQ